MWLCLKILVKKLIGLSKSKVVFVTSDVPTLMCSCVLCGRPQFLYGIDTDGRCQMCIETWQEKQWGKRLACSKLLSSLCRNKAYVVTKAVIEFLVTGRHGVYKRRTGILFDRCLLASSKAYFSDLTWTGREPDTDDELEDGILEPTLNYMNSFLEASVCPHANACAACLCNQ